MSVFRLIWGGHLGVRSNLQSSCTVNRFIVLLVLAASLVLNISLITSALPVREGRFSSDFHHDIFDPAPGTGSSGGINPNLPESIDSSSPFLHFQHPPHRVANRPSSISPLSLAFSSLRSGAGGSSSSTQPTPPFSSAPPTFGFNDGGSGPNGANDSTVLGSSPKEWQWLVEHGYFGLIGNPTSSSGSESLDIPIHPHSTAVGDSSAFEFPSSESTLNTDSYPSQQAVLGASEDTTAFLLPHSGSMAHAIGSSSSSIHFLDDSDSNSDEPSDMQTNTKWNLLSLLATPNREPPSTQPPDDEPSPSLSQLPDSIAPAPSSTKKSPKSVHFTNDPPRIYQLPEEDRVNPNVHASSMYTSWLTVQGLNPKASEMLLHAYAIQRDPESTYGPGEKKFASLVRDLESLLAPQTAIPLNRVHTPVHASLDQIEHEMDTFIKGYGASQGLKPPQINALSVSPLISPIQRRLPPYAGLLFTRATIRPHLLANPRLCMYGGDLVPSENLAFVLGSRRPFSAWLASSNHAHEYRVVIQCRGCKYVQPYRYRSFVDEVVDSIITSGEMPDDFMEFDALTMPVESQFVVVQVLPAPHSLVLLEEVVGDEWGEI